MIGTITFHWCTNFGAVIQAFALQTFLKSKGHDCEIIDYIPRRVALIQQYQMLKKFDLNGIKKYKSIKKFRRNWLVTTKHRYYNFSDLTSLSNAYDHIIVGSDQVWNESFTLSAEKKVTLSYFLAFAGDDIKRISYAASFGTDKVSQKYSDTVKSELKKFSAVSVRENTGIKICKELGVEAIQVCDPTLLLKQSDYLKLINTVSFTAYKVYGYILHSNQKVAWSVFELSKRIICDNQQYRETETMEEWLYNIKNANLVVTNSFHGLMFSLIFHTDFVVIPVEGSKMNNRIETILNIIGLSNRIIDKADENTLRKICKSKIDWAYVDNHLETIRQIGEDFLISNLK